MKVEIREKVKKILLIIGAILGALLSTIGTLLYFSIKWMFKTWTNLTMDELVYHMTAPLEGTNDGMIQEYLDVCAVPAILMLLLVVILFIAWRTKKRWYVVMGASIIVPIIVSGVSVHGAWNELDVGSFVDGQSTYSSFIDDNYVDPADVALTFPEQKRNLIYIFLESMEMTYADKENGGAFDKNVIPELTELAQENEDFSGEDKELNGGYAMTGATWTMGAMFAHTSGIPLSISIDGNDMNTQEHFFAGAVTLGDILESAGYCQNLMIGSDATFGGRRLYFTEHGNYNIYDYNYASENGLIPPDYRVWWGYEDEKLFSFAKDKLTELSQQSTPFNFTMLTVDTHFEDGYPCELCTDEFGDNQYANVMACSSRQVKELVDWIQQQDFYENTTIVIAGDHPTMDKDFCEDIDEDYIRKVYTTYINPAAELETTEKRNYTTFDNFPTTLAALGVKIDGNRLGLGTNLFSSTQTLTERFGIDKMESELKKKSKMMEKLGDIREVETDIGTQTVQEENIPAAELSIGDYDYNYSSLPISVTNISNVPGNIQSVMAAVWKEADQSDLQWIELYQLDDGSYYTDLYVADYGENPGDYNVHIYVIDELGTPTIVTGQTKTIN
ncbi:MULTISPECIES: GBS Bsp-like repeat-containing protein [Clostridia]|jgi:phosphoglycerol transferase|uniref:GBS Bsp-like repeat-containing protein n=1 Tax=Clostridia TaxID=186801 RepID=UPI000E518348|nr:MULTISPECIES: GBS Bsp-like repeat-containing protein [Clostridia]RGH39926.1 phosphoglycerol transferase [Firmicutes bacterium AM41-5BH]RHV07630.1 phosphoglycerol transferase [Firmicutes bacterium OM07-11]RKQ28504.1 phosphoglycerol transferase [Ruminococcus sp. B05]TAP32461.1 phosphoglycerol transferase [Mediterraneibacter sp. gm002]